MSNYRGNLVHVAEAVRGRGRGGDEILVHVNPEEFGQMQEMWGEPSINPETGLPEYGLFSKIKKALKFEAFNVKSIWDKVRKQPLRLLTGAIDPIGTEIANKMYGKDWDPAVNQLGGATEQTFADAEARGMDTGLARDLHKTAGLVAGFFGAQGLGKLASAGIGNLTQPAAQAVGSSSAATGAGSGLGQAAASAPAGMTAEGLVPISTAAIDTMAAPTVQGGGTFLSNLGSTAQNFGGKAWNYAKNPDNWATIAQGVQTVGGLMGNLAGEEQGGPPPPDPGYEHDVNYGSRQYQPGDYSRYYNYGEGPEHSYYTYGPMPEDLTGEAPPQELGLAAGGRVSEDSGTARILGVPMDAEEFIPPYPRGEGAWIEEGESPLSQHSRYMQDGPGGGQDDQIDAKLSPKEYVFDATTVAMFGDGNPDHGARKLDALRKKLWKDRGKHYVKGKLAPKVKDPEGYL